MDSDRDDHRLTAGKTTQPKKASVDVGGKQRQPARSKTKTDNANEKVEPSSTNGEGGNAEKQSPRSKHSSFQYISRAERLIDRFETEAALPWQESQDEFIAWLRQQVLPGLAQASRRQVRAALRYYYERVGLSPDKIPLASDPSIPKMKRADVTRRRNTSAGRKKGIREKDWRALILTLRDDPSVQAQLAGAMLVASRAFGLRPSEWLADQTRLIHRDTHVVLTATNGKYREDEADLSKRSFGPTRTLVSPVGAEGVSPNEIEAVNMVTTLAVGWANDVQGQRGVSHVDARNFVIHSLTRKVRVARKKARIKDKITLYSARHQFAADAKAAGLNRVEIAALMGHRSIETAGEHYGRRSAGWGRNPDRVVGFRVVPALENVRAVQSFNLSIEEALVGPKVPSITKWAPDF